MCNILQISICCLIMASCPSIGQVKPKRAVTEQDHALWSRITTGGMSADGKWISYAVNHATADTVFVRHRQTMKVWSVPSASNGTFSGGNFLVLDNSSTLQIISLKTGKRIAVPNVIQYEGVADGNYIVAITTEGEKQHLVFMDPIGRIVKQISETTAYKYNPAAKCIAYTTKSDSSRVGIVKMGKGLEDTIIAQSKADSYLEPSWQEDGQSLAFLRQDSTTDKLVVGFWKRKDGTIYYFDFGQRLDKTPMQVSMPGSFSPLMIAPDGERVFFGCRTIEETKNEAEATVEVWNASDRQTYPDKMKEYGRTGVKMGVWWPQTGKFSQVTDEMHPKGFLSGDQQFAVVYDPQYYAPYFTEHPDVDLFAIDIETGEKKKILEKIQLTDGNFMVSPKGKFMSYFKSGNWWLYDFRSNMHRCLTERINTLFMDSDHDWPGQVVAHGNPGWSADDGLLYLYDEHDVWEFSTTAGHAARLTHGKERGIRFRIVEDSGPLLQNINWDWSISKPLLEDGKLVLAADDGVKRGYWKYTRKKGAVPLVMKASGVDNLRYCNDCSFAYSEQQYEMPERIMVGNPKEKDKQIYQSNKHHVRFHWGRAERIEFVNSKGTPLKGILYYPANYNPKQYYPMVVRIYERQSHNLYRYHFPGYQSGTGYNLANLVLAGYFVLLPDMEYTIGNTGIAATDCVVSGVEKALGMAPIDRSNIGLMGHSFGGYEANFIITQTDIFKAAISGAANSDLVTSSFYYSKLNRNGNFWRSENGQIRMGKSFFEDSEGYRRNSPLEHLSQIKTPLLSWAGSADRQVNFYETPLLHMAMRRLGKEHIMLVYPDEEHTIDDPTSKRNLGKKIEEWFGYWLKGEAKPDWMANNFIAK